MLNTLLKTKDQVGIMASSFSSSKMIREKFGPNVDLLEFPNLDGNILIPKFGKTPKQTMAKYSLEQRLAISKSMKRIFNERNQHLKSPQLQIHSEKQNIIPLWI